jgi:hypothetical protein
VPTRLKTGGPTRRPDASTSSIRGPRETAPRPPG